MTMQGGGGGAVSALCADRDSASEAGVYALLGWGSAAR